MLSEFALIPEVLEAPRPEEAELHDAYMAQLADLLLNDGLVRDLRDGEWQRYVSQNLARLSLPAQKLLMALANSGRLRASEATELPPPQNSEQWLWEAQRSQSESPRDRKLTAVLAPHELAIAQEDDFVTSVRRLHKASWWEARACSIRLERRTGQYLQHLGPVLRHSNSLMFIDPNLDPTKPNYHQFKQLLEYAARVGCAPFIEIHRSCKDSTGSVWYPTRNGWIDLFEPLRSALQGKIKVFVWEDFHDRYLISNLIVISVPNGFDICTDEHRHPLRTTWTRLSRRDADDVRSEFDRSNGGERLKYELFP
jgi:hypothetical protein